MQSKKEIVAANFVARGFYVDFNLFFSIFLRSHETIKPLKSLKTTLKDDTINMKTTLK